MQLPTRQENRAHTKRGMRRYLQRLQALNDSSEFKVTPDQLRTICVNVTLGKYTTRLSRSELEAMYDELEEAANGTAERTTQGNSTASA